MRLSLLSVALLAATAAGAQTATPGSAGHPTKVVARSGRLVTARTSTGGTQSFNCKAPQNAKRAICRKR